MKINISVSAVRESSWVEWSLRFALGGLVTALAGVIGHELGPVVGGLFLAFPSIFPASVTLVETHEASKKHKRGLKGMSFARMAAGADAAGAALGTFGLMAFGGVVWLTAPLFPAWVVLMTAFLAWALVAASAWSMRKVGKTPPRRYPPP